MLKTPCSFVFASLVLFFSLETLASNSSHSAPVTLPLLLSNHLLKSNGYLDVEALAQHTKYIVSKYTLGSKGSRRAYTPRSVPAEKIAVNTSRDASKQLKSLTKSGSSGIDSRTAGYFVATDIMINDIALKAIVDTGSSLTIVDGKLYTPGSTSLNLHQNFKQTFLDGSKASGGVYADHVTVAGVTFTNSIVCRDEENFDFDGATKYGIHALIGLSRPGYQQGLGGILDRVRDQIEHALFSLTISDDDGKLYLGSLDPVARQKFQWSFSINNEGGYWTVVSKINGIVVPKNAIVDSGTVGIIVGRGLASAIFKQSNLTPIESDGMLLGAYPCNKPPQVTIIAGRHEQILSPQTLNLGQMDKMSCYLSIIGANPSMGLEKQAILGVPYLKNVYAAFDFANGRVGFASR